MPVYIKIKNYLKNKNGITLIELVAGLMVMSILMIGVTNIFLPIYRTYDYANNIAEVNTQLDNVAALIINDLKDAVAAPLDGSTFDGDELRINKGTSTVVYLFDDTENIFIRRTLSSSSSTPILSPGFYRNFIVHAEWETLGGIISLTLSFIHRNGGDGVQRTYYVSPAAMG